MTKDESVLVCIGDVDRDGCMLDYVADVAQTPKVGVIHLLHVAEHGEGAGSGDESGVVTRETLEKLVAGKFEKHPEIKVTCATVTGTPLLEILRYAHDKDVGLIVIGRSATEDETDEEAVLARRVARKATCSVLVLPFGAEPSVSRIMVPVRNSECSGNALKIACGIAKLFDAEVICIDVFQVTSGYSRVGSTLEEHTAILEDWAKKECKTLVEGVDTSGIKPACMYVPDLYDSPAPAIIKAANSERADLIVIGARGRTGAAGVLLGKVTEKLIQQSHIPVLAAKKKGECISLLQALLEIAEK